MDELVFGNWKVCEQIGHGGFGYVRRLEREDGFGGVQECALKVVEIAPEQPGEDALQDMLRQVRSEVESMIQLKGTSNIVSYEDHALIPMEQNGTVVACRLELRMELLDSLVTLMKQDIRAIMNEPTVLRIGTDLCQALILCHGQNILHRDIKPSNIFRNRFGNYKLGDFGIARLLEGTSSSMTRGIGTELYAAPEVFNGEHYDQRADLYSLGIVLYALMNNGDLPLQVRGKIDAHQATLLRCQGRAFAPPTQASEGLGQVILRACAYNPDDRYLSAQELFDALLDLYVAQEDGKTILFAGSTGLQSRVVEREQEETPSFDLSEPACLGARFLDSFGLGVRLSYETRYWFQCLEAVSAEQEHAMESDKLEQGRELTRAQADRLPPFRLKLAVLPWNRVVVPDGMGAVGAWAFHSRGDVMSVTLPRGVTHIGESAFSGCAALQEVRLPEGLVHIGASAFSGCAALRRITLPDSVSFLGEGAFAKSRLTRIILPISLTDLPPRAFANCTVLAQVDFFPALRTVGSKAFMNTALQELTLPDGVISIGTAAFRGCRSLAALHLPGTLVSVGAQCFAECTALTCVTLPEGLRSVSESMFSGCSALTSVILPEGLQNIGSQAFVGCESLASIYIPPSVTAIASDAFGLAGRFKRWMSKLIIQCVPGSYAWHYCGSNHIRRAEVK